jgi:hypothetical protein
MAAEQDPIFENTNQPPSGIHDPAAAWLRHITGVICPAAAWLRHIAWNRMADDATSCDASDDDARRRRADDDAWCRICVAAQISEEAAWRQWSWENYLRMLKVKLESTLPPTGVLCTVAQPCVRCAVLCSIASDAWQHRTASDAWLHDAAGRRMADDAASRHASDDAAWRRSEDDAAWRRICAAAQISADDAWLQSSSEHCLRMADQRR